MQQTEVEIHDIQSISWWKDAKILEMSAVIRTLEAKVKELEAKLNGNPDS